MVRLGCPPRDWWPSSSMTSLGLKTFMAGSTHLDHAAAQSDSRRVARNVDYRRDGHLRGIETCYACGSLQGHVDSGGYVDRRAAYRRVLDRRQVHGGRAHGDEVAGHQLKAFQCAHLDRKSTRLNSSH